MQNRRCAAFTLVELLVVIAIIGVLVALLLPAVQAAREAARRTQCKSNIRQLSLACLNFESAKKTYPQASQRLSAKASLRPDWSWLAVTMPYYEQGNLYSQINKDADWFNKNSTPNNEAVVTTSLSLIRCPSRGELEPVNLSGPGNNLNNGYGLVGASDLRAHYVGNLGANVDGDSITPKLPYYCTTKAGPYTMEFDPSVTPPRCWGGADVPCGQIANNGVITRFEPVAIKHITDGTSNTILIGESAIGPPDDDETVRPWIVGSTGNCLFTVRNLYYQINQGYRGQPGVGTPARNNIGYGSEHSSGTHFAFADGSVRFLNDQAELRTLYYMASRAGDETLPGDASN